MGGTGIGDCSVCAAESSSSTLAMGGGVVLFSLGVVPFSLSGGAGFALGIFGSFSPGHCGQSMHWIGDGI